MQNHRRPWLLAAGIVAAGLLPTADAQQPYYPFWGGREQRQGHVAEMGANAVLRLLDQTSCDRFGAMLQQMKERRAEHGNSEPPFRQRFQELMRRSPDVRRDFVNRIAGPLANKMLDCGLLPGL
jgi:hypothetical protein